MKERPILFSGPMIRAILGGIKTQTRRVVKLYDFDGGGVWEDGEGYLRDVLSLCPYGVPGDRLWVRYTWWHYDSPRNTRNARAWDEYTKTVRWQYDRQAEIRDCEPEVDGVLSGWKRRPSIHMPRWASRITLDVTGVRVERLQDITREDAYSEGVERRSGDMLDHFMGYKAARPELAFAAGWNSINAKRGFSWESNPRVWVVCFKPLKGEK